MIIARAPLRIGFVGGGTDLKSFYTRYPGRVISATINKYIYIVLNVREASDEFIIKYKQTETAKHPKEFKHERFREAMLELDLVSQPLEIASIADLPSNMGLGSSSSFSVALMKALHAYRGKTLSKAEVAEAACNLEIEKLREPIGKQDQYAAAFGGFNIFEFRADGSVAVEPLFLDFKTRSLLEDHSLLYFTGMSRDASSVLKEQAGKIADNFETYKQMSDSVPVFVEKLVAGDLQGMAKMLNEGWQKKKSLASGVSNSAINNLFEAGIAAGAWGGKILGAGGGGCLFFIAPPEHHTKISLAIAEAAKQQKVSGFIKIPFSFSHSGADILFNSSR